MRMINARSLRVHCVRRGLAENRGQHIIAEIRRSEVSSQSGQNRDFGTHVRRQTALSCVELSSSRIRFHVIVTPTFGAEISYGDVGPPPISTDRLHRYSLSQRGCSRERRVFRHCLNRQGDLSFSRDQGAVSVVANADGWRHEASGK